MIHKLIKFWLPVLLWAGMIFYFSSIPDLRSGLPDIFDIVFRKIAHAGEFGILAILLWRAILSSSFLQSKQSTINVIVIVIIIVILYAITDEIHQGFVPGRVASPIDVLIDSFGATLAWAVFNKIKNRSK
ncbi:hypothetical protein EPN15_02170 [Patescibacteria group bacterium]|nr:MAG: hypothetical protein EPN15_02170 [Patescibacteria group bacterium]